MSHKKAQIIARVMDKPMPVETVVLPARTMAGLEIMYEGIEGVPTPEIPLPSIENHTYTVDARGAMDPEQVKDVVAKAAKDFLNKGIVTNGQTKLVEDDESVRIHNDYFKPVPVDEKLQILLDALKPQIPLEGVEQERPATDGPDFGFLPSEFGPSGASFTPVGVAHSAMAGLTSERLEALDAFALGCSVEVLRQINAIKDRLNFLEETSK